MTLMKSLFLGSAAGIVAIASAQAADLPTRKGAPAAEYVRICSITVAGKPIVGWILPGSDTCFKLSGYVTAQIEGGNVKDGETLNYVTGVQTRTPTAGGGASGGNGRPEFGFSTRLQVAGDAVSNTAYGPLTAHFEMQLEDGSGFDNVNELAYINVAYVTWAGITAGKAASFYSFTGGGPGWANFFSPDETGFNQPDVFAYTASFGGGFSITGAIQSTSPDQNGSGTNFNGISGNNFIGFGQGGDYSYNGVRVPDLVGAIKLSQGWGTAQVSGVGHYVTVTGFDGAVQKVWGWGIDAGVSFNLPQIGAGDQIMVTGSYTEHAAWYSGIPDAMWGENGAVNGNGQQMALADTYENPDGGFAKPTIWTIQTELDHHFSPQFSGSLLGGYGEVHWSGTDATSVVSDSTTWIAGVVAHWDPVTNLDFEFELLYQDSTTDQPNGFSKSAFQPAWVSRGDGFATRLEITRSW
jgi:hypothetical protein